MRKTPISDAVMQSLTYANMKPAMAVTEVKAPSVHAWSYGKDMSHLDAWIHFDFREDRTDNRPGWKLHVSVDIADVAKAWDTVLPIAAAHGMKAKAMTEPLGKTLGNPKSSQAGKTIVLYGHEMTPEVELPYWKGLLESIEDALAAASVKPGWAVKGDFPVPGSAYSFVRNDRDPSGRYSHGIDAFDPYGIPGPFDKITLKPREVPEPSGDTASRTLRMLGFVYPGWTHDGTGACTEASSKVLADDLCRSLLASGLPGRVDGNTVSLDWIDEAAIRRSWHTALEISRCAQYGRIIQDRTHGELGAMTILRRRSHGMPPRVRFDVADPEFLVDLQASLSAITGLQSCMPVAEDEAILIPYAGRFHTPDGFDPHWLSVVERAVDQAYLSTRPGPSP